MNLQVELEIIAHLLGFIAMGFLFYTFVSLYEERKSIRILAFLIGTIFGWMIYLMIRGA